MKFRAATAADLPVLAAIQSASSEASQWDAASYLDYQCVVAEQDGGIVGFVVSRATAPDEHEILNLAIEPDYRRRGIARALLRESMKSGAWFLEVRESNLPAIRLYESLGFRPVGQRKNYYFDPREPAIVMKIDS